MDDGLLIFAITFIIMVRMALLAAFSWGFPVLMDATCAFGACFALASYFLPSASTLRFATWTAAPLVSPGVDLCLGLDLASSFASWSEASASVALGELHPEVCGGSGLEHGGVLGHRAGGGSACWIWRFTAAPALVVVIGY